MSNAGTSIPPPMPQPMRLEYARPGAPTLAKSVAGDRYFAFLCIVLLGYAIGGRGFAYWGLNPVFIGEISLVIGVGVLLSLGVLGRLMSQRVFLPLILFMCWGAICTLPYLTVYGKDAIRDAVVWGYGTFAFIVAGLLISDPTRIQKLVLNYRKFVILFLLLAPVVTVLSTFFEQQIPVFPGGVVPIIQVKGGDICVHLAGSFAFIVALGHSMNPWFTSLMIPLNLGLNAQGRAGLVTFAAAICVAMALRPFHPRMMRIFFVLALGLFFFWASDLRIERGAREISFDFLQKAVASIFTESDEAGMEGSKEWRMRWWTDIYHYTVMGDYFWMGKGFGVNLADSDGYNVSSDLSLRSPHNGHMTMLARSGVPGFLMWALVQGTWAYVVVKSYFRCRRNRLMNWSGVFMFLGTYWAAFMANATFDVFLEGPMGGIWFWCVYGAGLGCAYVYRRYPNLLTPPQPLAVPVTSRG